MVNWTGDKDAILLRGVFEKYDVKATQELCRELAEKVGEGCTAKAVSLRLYAFKKSGKANEETPAKKPASFARGSGKASKTKAVSDDNGPVDDEVMPTPNNNRKRARKVKSEEGDEPEAKKIKKEVDADEFEGILGGGRTQYGDPYEVDNTI